MNQSRKLINNALTKLGIHNKTRLEYTQIREKSLAYPELGLTTLFNKLNTNT